MGCLMCRYRIAEVPTQSLCAGRPQHGSVNPEPSCTQAARSMGLSEVHAQIGAFVEQYAAQASGPTKV